MFLNRPLKGPADGVKRHMAHSVIPLPAASAAAAPRHRPPDCRSAPAPSSRSASRPSAAGQALRIASICAGGSGARAARSVSIASRIGCCPCASAASCRCSASSPRLVQTCGSTPSPWIGQPRGASTRLQVTNSSPPSGSGVDGLHQPLAEGRAADHHRAAAVGQRGGQDLRRAGGAAVDHHDHRHVLAPARPARSARRGRPPDRAPRYRRRRPPAAACRPASTAWRSSPPRLPRRSRMMPSARMRARPCPPATPPPGALAVLRLNPVIRISSTSPTRSREHGLRRHHGAFQLGGARLAVAAAPGQRQRRSLRAGDQAGDRRGILAAGRLAVHRQHVSPGRMPAIARRSVRDRGRAPRSAPPRCASVQAQRRRCRCARRDPRAASRGGT